LQWTPYRGNTNWAIVRGSTPAMSDAQTVATTSAMAWVDTASLSTAFYQIIPFPISPPPPLDTLIVIEDFEDSTVTLLSYATEDSDTAEWEVISTDTYDSTQFALRLFGNTWKREIIPPTIIEFGTVWQVAMKLISRGELHAIGMADSANEMWYLIWGKESPVSMAWITTYEGWFEDSAWIPLYLPVGEDWQGRFGYLPRIRELRYVNDNDTVSAPGEILFDEIRDVTRALPQPPITDFIWSLASSSNPESVRVRFTSQAYDHDSPVLEHRWDFGDGQTSLLRLPVHNYRAHGLYTVTLTVTDETNNVSWRSHAIIDTPATQSREFTCAFVGDIMLARGYEAENGIIETWGVDTIFDPTRHLIESVDLASCNLESALTTAEEHHPTKAIWYKGNPANVAGIINAGFDFATIANNHILDYMEEGMLETMHVLDSVGIPYTGAGMNDLLARRTMFMSRDGLSIAMLCFSDRTGSYNNAQPFLDAARSRPGFAMWNRSAIEATIPEADALSDFVILNVHSGSEYQYQPQGFLKTDLDQEENFEFHTFDLVPDTMERVLRKYAIDNGADLVITHHPHIIQGFEVYQGKLIAHSLGNFIFDLNFAECFPTLILHTHFSAERGVDQAVVHPCFIDRWIPRPATGGLGRAILDYESEMSRRLDTWLMRKPNEDTARIIWDTTAAKLIGAEWTDTLALTQDGSFWVSVPLKLRGDGYPRRIQITAPTGAQFRLGREQLWFGSIEDEGANPWLLNSGDEGYNTDQSHSGVRSIRLRRQAGLDNVVTTLENRKPIDRNLPYSVAGWVRTVDAGNTTIEGQFWTQRTQGVNLGQPVIGATLTGNNGWTYLSGDLTVPLFTYFFNIRVSLYPPASGMGYAWFDDLALVQWTDWQESPTLVPFPSDFTFVQVRSSAAATQAVVVYRREWLP
jgi:poly-gamma-glutamate capsule biosynthesis protein CapA/YwtB (metallophosphatase superfamily)